MDNLKVIQKIQKAKTLIKEAKPKKDGLNEYSNYNYFTPEIVDKLVNDACEKQQLTTHFELNKDGFGHYGELAVICLETGATVSFKMRTERPVIKATNETQQMGGMLTYTKRYSKMNAFDIEDNSSDFDSQDNRPKKENKDEKKEVVWLSKDQFEAAMKADKKGILATLNTFNGTAGKQMSKDYKEQLTKQLSIAK